MRIGVALSSELLLALLDPWPPDFLEVTTCCPSTDTNVYALEHHDGVNYAVFEVAFDDPRFGMTTHCVDLGGEELACLESPPTFWDAELPEPGAELGLVLGAIVVLALAGARTLRSRR